MKVWPRKIRTGRQRDRDALLGLSNRADQLPPCWLHTPELLVKTHAAPVNCCRATRSSLAMHGRCRPARYRAGSSRRADGVHPGCMEQRSAAGAANDGGWRWCRRRTARQSCPPKRRRRPHPVPKDSPAMRSRGRHTSAAWQRRSRSQTYNWSPSRQPQGETRLYNRMLQSVAGRTRCLPPLLITSPAARARTLRGTGATNEKV